MKKKEVGDGLGHRDPSVRGIHEPHGSSEVWFDGGGAIGGTGTGTKNHHVNAKNVPISKQGAGKVDRGEFLDSLRDQQVGGSKDSVNREKRKEYLNQIGQTDIKYES